jgi:hypothetical protein
VSIKVDPFYGWAILVSNSSKMALVQKQRTEESAWIDYAKRSSECERFLKLAKAVA